jgi:hypothetical protein
VDRLGDGTAEPGLSASYPPGVGVDEVLLLLVIIWFGVHVSFPRGSQVSRFSGVLLATTFLQLVAWFALHTGAKP